MTNGEKMTEVLHDFNFEEFGDTISGKRYSPYCSVQFDRRWWNAEYKEPTTKNDLGVDNQNIKLINANALIKRLRPKHFDWWGEGEQDDFSKGTNSMLDEVIEAIEEFPSVTPQSTKNNLGVDCISRADLYNRIKKIDHDEDYECDEFGGSKITYYTCDWNEVLREIEDAPSVTPQATGKGRWLAIRTKDDTHEMTCSCCGYVVVELVRRRITEETALEYLKGRIDENKFCPNCGADMREVKV